MYRLARSVFFKLDAEKAHDLTIKNLSRFTGTPLDLVYRQNLPPRPVQVMGLHFKNPIGLAAGLDKNGECIDAFGAMGFGFVEVGTVTPRPQSGNDKPRLFRVEPGEGIINRMGFNNSGVEVVASRLKNRDRKVIVGGNIGKNKQTPNEQAVNDYLKCFRQLYEYVDYFVVNVSSPNTPNLRALQDKEPLTHLLKVLNTKNDEKTTPKPILLKIAPDLSDTQLLDIIEIVSETKIDGVIATNTTISRDGLTSEARTETGGLSGKPLTDRATEVIRFLSEKSNKSFPIIGVGGIHSAQDALEKLNAGASLVQLYTGFIYEGPALIKEINKAVASQRL